VKSEFELTQMMMAELRKHPECTEVDRVLLLRARGQRRQLGHSRRQEPRRINRRSWDAERAIARGLQERYDVSD
jgi:hypothetical protein